MKDMLTFDVMVDGGQTFYRTFHMPITLDVIAGYDGDKPIIDAEKIEEYVLKKCPTLKHEKFRICF